MLFALCTVRGTRVMLGWERIVVSVFFCQAEDGIRDKLVTGVQTCALPISFPCTGKSRNGGDGAAGKGEPGSVSRICRVGRGNFRQEHGLSTEGDARGAVFSRYESGAQHYYRAASRAGIEGGAALRRGCARAGTGAE